MITLDQYFAAYAGHEAITDQHREDAAALLRRVNELLEAAPYKPAKNPKTGTLVSGTKDGGWRPPECLTGVPSSAHKQGQAVDIYDPLGRLEACITDEILEQFGLYREAPDHTMGWVHLTTRAPQSGKRTFIP